MVYTIQKKHVGFLSEDKKKSVLQNEKGLHADFDHPAHYQPLSSLYLLL